MNIEDDAGFVADGLITVELVDCDCVVMEFVTGIAVETGGINGIDSVEGTDEYIDACASWIPCRE